MRKFLFTFIIAFALGVFCTIWVLSPGSTRDFLSKVTESGSLNLDKAQQMADWSKAEEKVLNGVSVAKEKVSNWHLLSNTK